MYMPPKDKKKLSFSLKLSGKCSEGSTEEQPKEQCLETNSKILGHILPIPQLHGRKRLPLPKAHSKINAKAAHGKVGEEVYAGDLFSHL
jgi:hypothetical protein